MNGYFLAGSLSGCLRGVRSCPGGSATSWVQEVEPVSRVWTLMRGAESRRLRQERDWLMP